MNRNEFESLLCLLREALPDKSRMFEIHGHKITKGRGYYVFKFLVSFLSQLLLSFRLISLLYQALTPLKQILIFINSY